MNCERTFILHALTTLDFLKGSIKKSIFWESFFDKEQYFITKFPPSGPNYVINPTTTLNLYCLSLKFRQGKFIKSCLLEVCRADSLANTFNDYQQAQETRTTSHPRREVYGIFSLVNDPRGKELKDLARDLKRLGLMLNLNFKAGLLMSWRKLVFLNHSDTWWTNWALGKFIQYEINHLCLCRPGYMYQIFPILVVLYTNFFKLYTFVPATSRLVGRSNKIVTVLTTICRSSWEFLAELVFSLPGISQNKIFKT